MLANSIEVIMNAVVVLYLVVYYRKLSKPQYKAQSVARTITRLTIGWIAINLMLATTYAFSTNVRGVFNPAVMTSFLVASTIFLIATSLILAVGNMKKYYKNTFI